MNQKRMILLSVAIVSAAGILAFQNCSVRRLNGGAGGLSSIGGAATNGAGATGGGTTGGGGGTTATKACMMQSDDVGSITGITGIPVIQTSYAMTLRSSNTTLMLTNSSDCLEKPPAVAPKCATPGPSVSPTGTPACVSKSSLTVSLMLTCDAGTTATTCTNFASKLNMDLAFDDAMLGSKIILTASYMPDVCNPAGVTSYFMPFSGAKTGTMKIMNLPDLNDGTVAKVKITGAKLFKNGTDMTNSITLDALASSEIVTFKACTP
jgi:hypothetical protein